MRYGIVGKQATTEHIEQVPTNGARQCSGCHRRNADLTLFENGKLYCTSCATSVTRLGIEPVVREERSPVASETDEPTSTADGLAEAGDEPEYEDTESEQEPVMAIQPVQPDEIAVMPSLATQSLEAPSGATPSAEVGLHGVLEAERARLLEQRTELDRRFRADVDAIDQRLAHVESLLGDGPAARAS
jgi:hypothetical protein